LTAVLLALGASLSWGCSDFLAGLKSRSLPVVAVLAVSQPAGLVLIGLILAVRGGRAPSAEEAAWAAASGVVGLLALTAFYRGLATGAMSVVAPISGAAAMVPLAVGLARGERPSSLQAAGVALAIGGVVLASRESGGATGGGSRLATGFGYAVVAALGFGFFFVALDAAGNGGAGVLWLILVLRAASSAVVVAATLALRPRLPRGKGALGALLVVGALDMTANVAFAAASTRGLVSLVSVLASLYPVVVVILARLVLRERISRLQDAGVVLVLAGVGLISVG
jgi:drug/metabolite transporter (DMT)-like permease